MKRFTKSYSALALLYFVLHLAGAFIIGCLAPSRWDSSSNLEREAVPTAMAAGLDALAAVALLTVIAYGIRFIAYRRLDGDAVNSRLGWGIAVLAEAAYLVFNLWLVYGATAPVVDSGFVWLAVGFIAFIVTLASLALLISVALVERRRRANAAQAGTAADVAA